MPLSPEEDAFVRRARQRLECPDRATYGSTGRSVGRVVARGQAALVTALRTEIVVARERGLDERRLGYIKALEDVLLAAEIALESPG